MDCNIANSLRRVTAELQAAGIEDASGDARRLLVAAIGGTSAGLIRDPGRVLTGGELAQLNSFVARRVAREPVARILGEREFYGRMLRVTPDVLEPRPDTETLIDVALELATREGWRERPIRILDAGTGSGAILLTLLAELPLATGLGIDISFGALECARECARVLGVATRCELSQCDMNDADFSGFDLVISNPPYIETGAIAGLEPEVRKFDPALALDGGPDGLAFYRTILGAIARTRHDAKRPLSVVLEAGAGQTPKIVAIAHGKGILREIEDVIVRHDLGGNERCVAFVTHTAAHSENSLEVPRIRANLPA